VDPPVEFVGALQGVFDLLGNGRLVGGHHEGFPELHNAESTESWP
jgi:hypothetical protein